MYYEMYNLMGEPVQPLLGSGSGLPPIPDLKVNGQNGPLFVSSKDPSTITISVDPRDHLGEVYDWWLKAEKGGNEYWYSLPGIWTYSLTPIRAYGGPLVVLNDFLVTQKAIPPGIWQITFCLDAFDGDYQGSFTDSVKVTSL
jgi:hypothetical protein